MAKRIFLILLSVVLAISSCTTPKTELSVDEFKNPSTEYRPLALWSWMNGYVDTTIKGEFKNGKLLKSGIMGNVLIRSVFYYSINKFP